MTSTKGVQLMTYDNWLNAVYHLDPDNFEFYTTWYSFFTAWEEGKTPKEAYQDCHAWIQS